MVASENTKLLAFHAPRHEMRSNYAKLSRPVLHSGLASLTLNSSEKDVLDKYFKQTLRMLKKYLNVVSVINYMI